MGKTVGKNIGLFNMFRQQRDRANELQAEANGLKITAALQAQRIEALEELLATYRDELQAMQTRHQLAAAINTADIQAITRPKP